jgi:hypothetical protein
LKLSNSTGVTATNLFTEEVSLTIEEVYFK